METQIPRCFNCGKRFNLVQIDGQLESVCRNCLDGIVIDYMKKDAA